MELKVVNQKGGSVMALVIIFIFIIIAMIVLVVINNSKKAKLEAKKKDLEKQKKEMDDKIAKAKAKAELNKKFGFDKTFSASDELQKRINLFVSSRMTPRGLYMSPEARVKITDKMKDIEENNKNKNDTQAKKDKYNKDINDLLLKIMEFEETGMCDAKKYFRDKINDSNRSIRMDAKAKQRACKKFNDQRKCRLEDNCEWLYTKSLSDI